LRDGRWVPDPAERRVSDRDGRRVSDRDGRRVSDRDGRRVSDQDRDRVASILSEALATGRLTPEEHQGRLDLAFSAATVADLEPLTRDLPVPIASAPGLARTRAVLSKIRRQGQWVMPADSTAVAILGAAVMDLRHAEFTAARITVRASSLFGKVDVVVPAGAQVIDTGTAVAGKRTIPDAPPAAPGGPVVHFTGRSLFGKLTVRRAR
jgi:hypothetical protein